MPTPPDSNWHRFLGLLKRFPILNALPVYVAGVLWRVHHVYSTHDPRGSIYSDMLAHVDTARRIANAAYKLTPHDVIHPPATSWLFSKFYASDPSLHSLMVLQVVVSSLIPLAVGALAWVAFNQKSAAWAVAVSSAYYYYVEFAGFFLAEIYMMLLIPLAMALYLWAVRAKSTLGTIGIAALAGIVLFLAIVFKAGAAPAILGFALVHWLFTRGPSRRVKSVALVVLCLVTLPGLFVTSQRCTRANQGNFCVTSSKSAADFLLGHYDRIHSLKWADSQIGSPAAQQHGYEHVPQVHFSITDGGKNLETAFEWIQRWQKEAVVLSVQHVFDLFNSNIPWPTMWTPEWPFALANTYLFVLFMIWPSWLLLFDVARTSGLLKVLCSVEFAIFSVLFGISMGVFIANGEPRDRLPYDCVFIVLGVEFYRRMFARHAWRPRPKRQLAGLLA